jgi:hypothetical protein
VADPSRIRVKERGIATMARLGSGLVGAVVVGLASALWSTHPPATIAAECVVIRTTGMATVDPCERIVAPAEVCYEDRNGGPTCLELKKGDPSFTLPDAEVPRPGWGRRLLAILRGDEGVAYGGKRLKRGEQLPGFPYGEVVMPSAELTVRLDDVGASAIRSFDLFASHDLRRPLFSPGVSGNALRVPATVLRAGSAYTWVAATTSGRVRGAFKVIDRSQQAEVERELGRVRSRAGASEIGRWLLEAAVYDDFGYLFDRDAMLARIRLAGGRRSSP